MDERFMAEALELAARGRGFVSPNPMVGAVLVKGGRVVGRGYHHRFGGPHAEVEAIKDAGSRAKGAALYVTMEPCCFHGKTPACTGAVLESGVKRVVAATLDPNPRVNGKGMRQLRGAGIAVDVGLLREKARRLNEAYFTFMRELRPFVTLKLAATLDGMIADDKGESQWITGAEARRYVQWLRLGADVVVVGAGTVLADNPRLTCRGRGRRATARAVLDSELVTPVRARLFSEPGAVIIFTSSTSVQRARSLEKAGAEVVRVRGAGLRLPWPRVLAEFYQRQFMSVLVEGGAEVASSALDAGVVDKLCVIHAPKLLGPGLSFSRSMRPRPLALALGLRNVTHTCMGDDMLTEGYVHRAG